MAVWHGAAECRFAAEFIAHVHEWAGREPQLWCTVHVRVGIRSATRESRLRLRLSSVEECAVVTAAQWGKGRIGMQVICLDRLPPHDSKLLGALHQPIVVPHSAIL